MEALLGKPLAFSTSQTLVSATSRLALNTKDGALLNIEIFDHAGTKDNHEAPILLVLHGVCASAETLGVQAIVAAAKGHSVKVAVLELEGHGLSSGKSCVCGDFNRMLAHVLEAVQFTVPSLRGAGGPSTSKFSEAPFFITGQSLGGVLAIYAAEEISKDKDNTYPKNFKGLAPIAPAVGVDPRAVPPTAIVQCLRMLAYIAPATQVPFTPLEDPTNYNCPADSNRNFSGHWPLATSKMLLDVTSNIVASDLKDGKLSLDSIGSVLTFAAEEDEVVPKTSIKAFHDAIKPGDKDLLMVPKAGHDLMCHEASSKVVTQALFAWIALLTR